MITQIKTIEELKEEFFITFRSNSGDKVTKILPNTVINGLAYGIAKLTQKIIKNNAQIEAKLFPEYANEEVLNDLTLTEGIPQRLQGSKSSVIITLFADEDTVYTQGMQVTNAAGIIFELKEGITIGEERYGHVIAESLEIGEKNNVEQNTLQILLSTPPAGHIFVTNAFKAFGGTDEETDYDLKQRIKNGINILSVKTDAYYNILLKNINPDVLRIHTRGLSSIDNSFEIIVVKNSLGEFSNDDLTDMKEGIIDYIPLADRNNTKINIANVTFEYIDVFVPVKLKDGFLLEDVLMNMQVAVSTFLDLRYWEFGKEVHWDDILSVCKKVNGVEYIDNNNFLPQDNINPGDNSLPRIREFTIKNIVNEEQIGKNITPAYWNIQVNNYLTTILTD